MRDDVIYFAKFLAFCLTVAMIGVILAQTEYGSGLAVATVGERKIVSVDDAANAIEKGPAPAPGPCGSLRIRTVPGYSSVYVCGADGVWIRVAGRKSW